MSSPHFSTEPATRPEFRWLGRWFTGVRREGLLAKLTPEIWHTLSAILSFTSSDGRRSFTVDQLALATGQSREQATICLNRLCEYTWDEQPLATLETDRDGAVAGITLAPLEVLEQVSPDEGPPASQPDATTARTPPAAESTADDLASALFAVGLNHTQVERLISHFPPELVQRQLAWLPARHARNPAALLIRAVEQDWEPPREAR